MLLIEVGQAFRERFAIKDKNATGVIRKIDSVVAICKHYDFFILSLAELFDGGGQGFLGCHHRAIFLPIPGPIKTWSQHYDAMPSFGIGWAKAVNDSLSVELFVNQRW